MGLKLSRVECLGRVNGQCRDLTLEQETSAAEGERGNYAGNKVEGGRVPGKLVRPL